MIIRSANISMVVDDTGATIDRITAAGESVGGYVSDSKVWRDGEQLRGAITLRIPADRLSAALAVIRKLAVRINSETIGSQEVTQEYVDLESQLRNLEAAEVELRQLMTTIRERSKKASEVLEMYQQLSTIRGQIDQIKGRMRYLSQMSAFASVQVDLVPNALAKPVVEPGWQPLVIVKDASRSLVEGIAVGRSCRDLARHLRRADARDHRARDRRRVEVAGAFRPPKSNGGIKRSMANEKVAEFVNYFDRIRERTMRVAACVPPEKIDWTYREGKFTLGDLMRHLGAIERWMFAENAQRRPSTYRATAASSPTATTRSSTT